MLFPNIIVDNFFDYPDKVREFALAQTYYKDTEHRWPGLRTDPIHEINLSLFHAIMDKIFSLMLDLRVDPAQYNCDLRLQKTDASHKGGWIHVDGSECVAAFVIYLSPDADVAEGTSLYEIKDPISHIATVGMHIDRKKESFADSSLIAETEKYRIEANSQYRETMFVGNVYNRMFLFDGTYPHGVKDFISSSSNPRLTLIGFLSNTNASQSPIQRMRAICL
jgi:hypothetical protein